jgi:hypothetical protein
MIKEILMARNEHDNLHRKQLGDDTNRAPMEPKERLRMFFSRPDESGKSRREVIGELVTEAGTRMTEAIQTSRQRRADGVPLGYALVEPQIDSGNSHIDHNGSTKVYYPTYIYETVRVRSKKAQSRDEQVSPVRVYKRRFSQRYIVVPTGISTFPMDTSKAPSGTETIIQPVRRHSSRGRS